MLPSTRLCLGNCNIRLHCNSKLILFVSYRAEPSYDMNSNAMYSAPETRYSAAASYDNAYYTTTYATPYYKAEARQYNAQPK